MANIFRIERSSSNLLRNIPTCKVYQYQGHLKPARFESVHDPVQDSREDWSRFGLENHQYAADRLGSTQYDGKIDSAVSQQQTSTS